MFFAQGVGDAFAEMLGGVGESEERLSHDFDSEEFVAGEAMQADGALEGVAVFREGGKFFFAAVAAKAHTLRPGWLIKNERKPRLVVSQQGRGKEFFL